MSTKEHKWRRVEGFCTHLGFLGIDFRWVQLFFNLLKMSVCSGLVCGLHQLRLSDP